MTRKLKLSFFLFSVFFAAVVAAGLFYFYEISCFIKEPADATAKDQEFIVQPGQSLEVIARNLEKKAIISNRIYFILFTKFKKADKKLKAGEYTLSGARSPEKILETLVNGKVKLYRITFPEGLNINKTALLVEKADICLKTKFVELCNDSSFIKSLGIKAATLEGYLFPDTYFFPKNISCRDLISNMLERFNKVFTDKWKYKAKALDFSVHEIVTLASIIEKETGDATERPLISSVFHNRLEKKMRLESDPTVIYGIQNFDGNIKRKHLKMQTPYNTYQIAGLPKGPIANPGAMSMQAALYPAESEYLFFVSKKDTTHKFSKTIQEHNQAVKKYLLRKQ